MASIARRVRTPSLSGLAPYVPSRSHLRFAYQRHVQICKGGWQSRSFTGGKSANRLAPNPRILDKTYFQLLAFLGVTAAITLSWKLGISSSPVLAEGINHPQDDTTSTASTLPLSAASPPQYNLSPQNLAAALAEFQQLLGDDHVDTRFGVRKSHSSTEWSPAPNGDADVPSMIVYPGSTADVSAIARICHRRRIPMIAFSGGTSLEGTLAAQHQEVCLDFRRMDRVLAVRPDDMDVTVEAAVGFEELNAALAGTDMFFPPDPGPGARIAGMISQGCSGTNAYRYGTVKDWVLGLEVVLADGTVIETRKRPRKSSAGYDLTRLFTGSEGTLGFITKAHLKVTRPPQNLRVAVAQFATVKEAVRMAVQMVQGGLQLEAMELLDESTMHGVNLGGYCSTEWDEKPTLFLKLAGPTPTAVDEMAGSVKTISKNCNATLFRLAKDDEEGSEIWQARKTALWSSLALKHPDEQMLSGDACVPISRVSEIVMKTQDKAKEVGMTVSFVGHVGDGNVHTLVLYRADKRVEARKLISDVQQMSVDMDGTVSGEHGIGLEYRDQVIYELGEDSVDAMRRIKYALDPLCLLNPGKMIRVEKENSDS